MAYLGRRSLGGRHAAQKKSAEPAESEATLKAAFEEWCALRTEARDISTVCLRVSRRLRRWRR